MKTDRVVVVTGAAGGMGALIVKRFLANGDTVFATDSSDEALDKLRASVAKDAHLHSLAADISDESSCRALAGFVREKSRKVDVLVNCAGYFPTQPFDETPLVDWNKVIGINLTGVFLMTQAMLPLIKGRGWGRIINIGSGSMFEGVDEVAASLDQLVCPVLLFSSRTDHVVPTESGDLLAAKAAGPLERICLERSYHVATLDHDAAEIEERAVDFVKKLGVRQ